jgi:calcium-dependent protein kinase
VTKCRHRTSKQNRACKTIAKKKVKNMAQFNAEINILQLLDNPYILKLYEFFEDDTNFYVITELCTGGEMFDRIIEKEFYTEAEAAHAFKQFM